MVTNDLGLPDPPDSDDSLTTNTEIVMMNDSESDDDNNEYNGYEPLPFEIDDNEQIGSEDELDDLQETPVPALPPLSRMEDTLVQELWSDAVVNVVDIKMDKEKEDEVKQAMLNVTLPPSSIPEWANAIPEEEWKDHLLQRLQCMKKSESGDAI